MKLTEYVFYDSSKFKWCWDGERVYMASLELELPYKENGYEAKSLEEAIGLLMENGYMEEVA